MWKYNIPILAIRDSTVLKTEKPETTLQRCADVKIMRRRVNVYLSLSYGVGLLTCGRGSVIKKRNALLIAECAREIKEVDRVARVIGDGGA